MVAAVVVEVVSVSVSVVVAAVVAAAVCFVGAESMAAMVGDPGGGGDSTRGFDGTEGGGRHGDSSVGVLYDGSLRRGRLLRGWRLRRWR